MNRKLIWSLITILVLVVLGGAYFGFKGKQALPTSEIKIGDQVFKVEVAEDMMARARGLSGREKLDENQGMLFIFNYPGDYGFWMKDMKFGLDLVWIKENRVVGFAENVQPEPGKTVFGLTTYHPPEAVDKVLEVNAGTVGKYGFKIGDRVEFND
ncbi:MAG: DUF192 domain-containing protein [Candidatus Liptonbacteria bacterium]|nr:DUF192 domain-containing protein [Candidatus Liptonbacteria bacterium]